MNLSNIHHKLPNLELASENDFLPWQPAWCARQPDWDSGHDEKILIPIIRRIILQVSMKMTVFSVTHHRDWEEEGEE